MPRAAAGGGTAVVLLLQCQEVAEGGRLEVMGSSRFSATPRSLSVLQTVGDRGRGAAEDQGEGANTEPCKKDRNLKVEHLRKC